VHDTKFGPKIMTALHTSGRAAAGARPSGQRLSARPRQRTKFRETIVPGRF